MAPSALRPTPIQSSPRYVRPASKQHKAAGRLARTAVADEQHAPAFTRDEGAVHGVHLAIGGTQRQQDL
jgi:hypothetical protein